MNRPARLNRFLLGLIGLALLAAGGYALAAQQGRLAWVDKYDRLVPGTAAPRTWVLIVTVIGAVVLALAALRWLATQPARLPRPVRWVMDVDDTRGGTVLDSATAATPVQADIESYDGVRSALARLSGPGEAPALHLVVTAEPEADLPTLRRVIHTHAVDRLRRALEVETVAVTMELRLADGGRAPRIQ